MALFDYFEVDLPLYGIYPFYKHFPKSDDQKMTFAVGRIRKCTLKLKLLVFLFCSPEVGLSCYVKCAGVLVPCPNLRVSAKRPIVHFGDEGANTLKYGRCECFLLEIVEPIVHSPKIR